MYPATRAIREMLITVGHLGGTPIQIYVEMSGNMKGIPVIYLHGGPGDHVTPYLRRLFNPKEYCIVLMDQRGCGKSLPRNHLIQNTTQDLIKDIALVQNMFQQKIVLAGGSWGTALALLYAIEYPTKVCALVLRGVYDLSTDSTVIDSIYPENTMKEHRLPDNDRALLSLLKNKKSRRRVTKVLADPTPMYVMSPASKSSFADDYTVALIGQHYEAHHFFVPPMKIKRGISRIRHIPTFMVNGRYDIVTPASIAYNICKKMDHCSLEFVQGGHTIFEPEVAKAFVKATDKCAALLKKKMP